MLEGEKFKELEDIGSKYRTEKSRLPSSTWKLDFYYRGGVMCANDKPKAVLATVCRAHLEKWKQAMPISATPLIFLVDNYYQQAWMDRGNGFVSGMGRSQLDAFTKDLNDAWAISESATQLLGGSFDPFLANRRLEIAHLLNLSDEDIHKMFLGAIESEPDYYEFYQTEANYLQPKWGGADGEIKKFLEWSVAQTNSRIGKSLYALIPDKLGIETSLNEYGIAWENIHAGFKDLEKSYPNSLRNDTRLAEAAVIAEDKDAAKEAFARIGDAWDENVESSFRSRENLQKKRAWAMAPDTPKPAIILAALKRDTTAIATLIKSGVNVAEQDDRGRSALAVAVNNGDTDIVKMLLDAGAPQGGMVGGELPLQLASYFGRQEMVEQMLKHWPPEIVNSTTGSLQPIHLAAMGGYPELVRYLMNLPKVDVNSFSKDHLNLTPLHLAVRFKREEVVKVLLSNPSIDINRIGSEKKITPLHLAVETNAPEIVKVLLAAGAKTNVTCGKYGNAAQFAGQLGFKEIARLFHNPQ